MSDVRKPRWARWCLGVGVALALVSGGSIIALRATVHAAADAIPQADLLGSAAPTATHASVSGAKNVLLVGIDRRATAKPGDPTRSDSIILLHISADHQHAYLISLPRDSYVSIPAYDNGAQSYRGGKNKINAAFAYGSRGLTGTAALTHGFQLLSLTVEKLTGITPDAGAVVDFEGFQQIVTELGQVCMYVDEDTTSIHVGHRADGSSAAPYALNSDGTVNHKIKGVTANFYAQGNHCFTPADALDFVRQRDLLANHDADYGRQRHQQQFLKAVLEQTVSKGLDSPTKLPGLLTAVGKAVTVDGGGVSLEDWVFAMRNLDPSKLVTLKTNAGQFNSATVPGAGSVQILSADSLALFQAAKNDRVGAFAAAHPSWVAGT
ncbi:LCP family protein [Actinoplanes bogorensis]|uniref:LCP family protein n=1 Tax=Paractinoplanes bogorensis TaxID=1610840 RepID=A0ABS5YNS8_9ACTN|nr:LCP family protein [Actinoplanes bogorensis]